jgi:hypothetical protein
MEGQWNCVKMKTGNLSLPGHIPLFYPFNPLTLLPRNIIST